VLGEGDGTLLTAKLLRLLHVDVDHAQFERHRAWIAVKIQLVDALEVIGEITVRE